ncbi:Glycoside hydrolase, catalytic domain-containing protein, partial [Cynara cardunculus var. scolymus]
MFTYNGYVIGTFAPGRSANCKDSDVETEPYTVAYNLLNCHAVAYKKYEKDYKSFQRVKWELRLTLAFASLFVVRVMMKMSKPCNMHMISGTDVKVKWPENMQKFSTTPTANYPKGLTLPEFSDDQCTKLIDSYDFLGINYYTAFYIQYQALSVDIPPGYTRDGRFKASGNDSNGDPIGKQAYVDPTNPMLSWVYLCPAELTELLYLVKNTYNVSKPIIITENGSPEMNDTGKTYQEVWDDTYRLEYIQKHLTAIRTAICNKVNVKGYFAWSFMDSFEWSFGYKDRFGLTYVDYVNNLQRYPKTGYFRRNFRRKFSAGNF